MEYFNIIFYYNWMISNSGTYRIHLQKIYRQLPIEYPMYLIDYEFLFKVDIFRKTTVYIYKLIRYLIFETICEHFLLFTLVKKNLISKTLARVRSLKCRLEIFVLESHKSASWPFWWRKNSIIHNQSIVIDDDRIESTTHLRKKKLSMWLRMCYCVVESESQELLSKDKIEQ